MQQFEEFLKDLVQTYTAKQVEDARKAKKLDPDPISPHCFKVERQAGSLVQSAKDCAKHHRERETYYVKALEEAEKDLRENGVSMEVYDASAKAYLNVTSASICSGGIGSHQQQFQPRIDQARMDKVTNAKNKMLEHRNAASQYEKYAAAFALAPDTVIVLTIEEVHYFRLKA